MNIVVSNNAIKYNGFIKVSSLREASNVTGEIEYFVYHKSNESSDDKIKYLSLLKEKVENMVYIRDKEAVEQEVQLIVVGSKGKYFEDEFFLSSSEELSNLLNSIDEVTELVELGGVNVLQDFFSRFLSDRESGFNKAYLSIVKDAVSTMVTEYKQKDMEILQLSETAADIFVNSAKIIAKVESESENLKDLVKTLEDVKNQGRLDTVRSNVGVPNVMFFPQVPYMKERNIIRVKEIGNCTYLTSFMLGFRQFLEKIKYVKPKLIFIYPVGKQYENLYADDRYSWVTQDTANSMDCYYNDVVFTNFPNRKVITGLLDDVDYDTFIVVDRMKMSKDHILNSKGNVIRYAVSGSSVIDKYKLGVTNCFSSSDINNELFKLDSIKDYPKEIDQRERLYLKYYSSAYESLYNIRR